LSVRTPVPSRPCARLGACMGERLVRLLYYDLKLRSTITAVPDIPRRRARLRRSRRRCGARPRLAVDQKPLSSVQVGGVEPLRDAGRSPRLLAVPEPHSAHGELSSSPVVSVEFP
jgi:hypothetical protein